MANPGRTGRIMQETTVIESFAWVKMSESCVLKIACPAKFPSVRKCRGGRCLDVHAAVEAGSGAGPGGLPLWSEHPRPRLRPLVGKGAWP
jgi:hypothetical protein